MNSSFWLPSEDQKKAILLLEVAGLFHDLGKLSGGFIKKEASDKLEGYSYDYELTSDPNKVFPPMGSISEDISEMQRKAKRLNREAPFKYWPDMTGYFQDHSFQCWDGQQYNLAEVLLLAIPYKDWPASLGKSMQPARLIGDIHSVAHYEKDDVKTEEIPEREHYKQPYKSTWAASPFGVEKHIEGDGLTDALKALPLQDISKIHTKDRRSWLATVRKQMMKGVADTRRPTNEVLLWDWGYTVATMTKAAAAWIFKNNYWPEKVTDIPYRTLRVNRNLLDLYAKSDKISDLLGVRQILAEAYERVRVMLEETYAVANCFYHDETGAYYLFSDMYSNDEIASLRREIQAQFPDDLCPQVHLGEPVKGCELNCRDTSSYNPLAAQRLAAEPRAQAACEEPISFDNNLCLFGEEWAGARPENAEICMVCGVRPVGYPRRGASHEIEQKLAKWSTQEKAAQRNICRVCLDRRGRRAQEWATGNLRSTIWTDEVADDNGRLALFVGRLGLENWLDGTLLETIQAAGEKIKIASPARLYRIAETARLFWTQVSDQIVPRTVEQRPYRLALYPSERKLPNLGDYHTYELGVEGLALSVVWDTSKGRFLTVDNLAYFADQLDMSQNELPDLFLRGTSFDVLEPSAFKQPGRLLDTVHIERVEKLGDYQPAIPLLAEPMIYMALVPADKALDLARRVKSEYEQQMGRVRDRLPLNLGLVFFPRRTPIRAVLEAGHAMLDLGDDKPWEGWRLSKNDISASSVSKLFFDNGITWQIPVMAGDEQTPDIWYPRLYEGECQDKKQLRHVKDLLVSNQIWVRPSYFDFEFLDSNSRRFEICYNAKGRRPRRTRPFYLEDLDRLDALWYYICDLAVSQRHQVIHTIEATREMWFNRGNDNQAQSDEVFRQFVADTLAGASWPKEQPWTGIPPVWQKKLIEACFRGELADLAELHMEILKNKGGKPKWQPINDSVICS